MASEGTNVAFIVTVAVSLHPSLITTVYVPCERPDITEPEEPGGFSQEYIGDPMPPPVTVTVADPTLLLQESGTAVVTIIKGAATTIFFERVSQHP